MFRFLKTGANVALAATLALAASQASAMTVVYNWSPLSGVGETGMGSGSLTIDDSGITDAANFNVGSGALINYNYQWDNGGTLNPSTPFVFVSAPNWQACNGYLISTFYIAGGANSLSNPGSTCSSHAMGSNNASSPSPENNYGYWTLATTPEVPVPGAVWLLGSALLGLAGLRRRAA